MLSLFDFSIQKLFGDMVSYLNTYLCNHSMLIGIILFRFVLRDVEPNSIHLYFIY